MALTHFGFIVTGDCFESSLGTENFTMKVIGVKQASEGIAAAKKLVSQGVQLIELCGGFGPVWTGKIIESIDHVIPVGSVNYGPESIDAMYYLFN